MAQVRRREMPHAPEAQAIVKLLAEVNAHSHVRQDSILNDWLTMCEIALRRLPRIAEHAAATGAMLPDEGEDLDAWKRVMHLYKAQPCMELLSQAFHLLLDAAEERIRQGDWWDFLGDIYMNWGWPNSGNGQFFTPWPVARLMAEMSLSDLPGGIEDECRRRAAAAIDQGTWARMGLISGASITEPGKENAMLYALAMSYAHLEPLRISDPTAGSGVMLLAAASLCPRWALDYGVVQFSGADIDQICVTMCRINFMLYGLNGYFLELHSHVARGCMRRGPEAQVAVVTVDADATPVPEPGIRLDGALVQMGMFAA